VQSEKANPYTQSIYIERYSNRFFKVNKITGTIYLNYWINSPNAWEIGKWIKITGKGLKTTEELMRSLDK